MAKVGRLVETNGFMVDLAMTLTVIAADPTLLPVDHPGLQPEAVAVHIGHRRVAPEIDPAPDHQLVADQGCPSGELMVVVVVTWVSSVVANPVVP